MKRFWSQLVLLLSLALVLPPLALADVPGRGYDPTSEPCGYVMGRSAAVNQPSYSQGFVNADAVSNSDQACADANGFFYKDNAGRNSNLLHSKWGYMDLAWSANPSENVRIDPVTGQWYGRAKLTQLTSKLRATPQDDKLQFDWTCHGETWCSDAVLQQYRVKTDLSTGAISGVAWNVHTGYVSFTGLTMELPPMEIQAFVDVYANNTEVIPQTADLSNAPLADGYQSWRASVKLFDVRARRMLTEQDVTSMNIAVTLDSNITIDQVANRGAAVFSQTKNPAIANCGSLSAQAACLMAELSGDKSWNSFIYSVAPTSNMLGVMDTTGRNIEYPADRFGGIGFYLDDPWAEKGRCRNDCNGAKADVFYDRSTDRNHVSIQSIAVSNIQFSPTYLGGRNYTLDWGDGSAVNGTSFTYAVPANEQELKFRPNFRTKQFEMDVNGRATLKVPDDSEARNEIIPLNVDADWTNVSPESIAAGRTQRRVGGNSAAYRVTTRADETVLSGGSSHLDTHFVFKLNNLQYTKDWIQSRWGEITEDDPVPTYTNFQCADLYTAPAIDPNQTLDPLGNGVNNGGGNFPGLPRRGDAPRRDVIAYDPAVVDDQCPPGYTYTLGDCLNNAGQVCTYDTEYVDPDITYNLGRPFIQVVKTPIDPFYTDSYDTYFVKPIVTDRATAPNDLDDMTVEQYVCEPIDDLLKTRFNLDTVTTPSVCYYTAYLSIKGARTEPLPFKVTGTVDRHAGTGRSDLAVLGSSDLPQLRNQLYAKVARYALGQSAEGGETTLDGAAQGGIKELLDGRLLLARGDVTIDGSDGFSDTTLAVLNGDVFIDGDITGGRLQILVFGGNVYIDPSVKELNINLFTDGSVFSDSGAYDANGVPVWGTGSRAEALVNQLQIKGSVLSCNSIGGSTLEDGAYSLGCGETTTDPLVALERDLAQMRQFTLCYELDGRGNPTDEIMACPDTDEQTVPGFAMGVDTILGNDPWEFSVHVEHETPSSRQLDFGIF